MDQQDNSAVLAAIAALGSTMQAGLSSINSKVDALMNLLNDIQRQLANQNIQPPGSSDDISIVANEVISVDEKVTDLQDTANQILDAVNQIPTSTTSGGLT